MNDGTPRPSDEAPPTTAEIRRRSVIPRTGDPLIYPSGKIAQDPKRYNVPTPVEEELPQEPLVQPVSSEHPAEVEPVLENHVFEPATHEPTAAMPSAELPLSDRAPDAPSSRKKWLIVGAAGFAVIGLVTVLIVTLGGRDPVVAADASPSPSPSLTATPSPTADASVGFGLLDDGIADDEYPAAAPDRGDGFPAAYVMEEWIWDKAGPGWALSAVSGAIVEDYGEPVAVSDSYVYLNSPEGKAFELFALPDSYVIFPAVVGWLEDERQAWILADFGETGALFDLTTGVPDPLSFRMSSGTSQSAQLVTALADNTELWVARGNDWTETRVIKRSPDGDWTRVLPQDDYYFSERWTSVSPDGERVLFQTYSNVDSGFASSRSGSDLFSNFVVYDLVSNKDTLVRPDYPSGFDYCFVVAWHGDDPAITCSSFSDEPIYTSYEVSLDGSLRSIPVVAEYVLEAIWYVDEYTDPQSNLIFVSAKESTQTYELRLARGDDYVVLAAAGEDWSRAGVHVSRLVNVKDGVYRIETFDAGAFLVDTHNGIMTTLVANRSSTVSNALPTSAVYFGEVSNPADYNSYRYF